MLEFVIEAMVDAVVVLDSEGKITLANAGAAQLSGYAREELRGTQITRLLADDSSGLRTRVRRRIEDGAVLRREDSWLVTKDGERIPVSVTGSPVIDGAGITTGIVIVARDVREVRRLVEELRIAKAIIEEKLDQTRTQLLLAERRATLGTLAGGVGHELRNIAQIQVAAVDELSAALRAQEDVTELARQILPELERVSEHITAHGQRLMQLARPGPDHVAPIDLNTVVRDVGAMLRLAGKLGRVELVMNLRDAPVTVTMNRTRIEQILVNLITNAVDATAPGGTVTIDAAPDPAGTRIVCGVRDTGSGIPADQLEKIFEPFFTTKGERGTGLGLPVVRDIVESYGGKLAVRSEVGVGTTFTFDLPA